jgi:hypothetical protein
VLCDDDTDWTAVVLASLSLAVGRGLVWPFTVAVAGLLMALLLYVEWRGD